MSVRSNLSRAMRKAKTASSPSWLAVAPRSRAEDEVLRESDGELSRPRSRAEDEVLRESDGELSRPRSRAEDEVLREADGELSRPRSRAEDEVLRESDGELSRPRSRERDDMLREALAGAVEMSARARARSESALSNDLKNEYGVPPATAPAAAQDADPAWSAVPLPPVPRVEPGATPQPRHIARCGICQHPSRELIEREFIEWRSISSICANFGLPSKTTVYLHARAAGLFAERRGNVHMALENLIEQADAIHPSGMSIVKAVKLHARITRAASGPPSVKTRAQLASGETGKNAEARIPALPEPGNPASGTPELPPAKP